jgi:RsiW-degrading membrane proteinase PrsW (M82 family)
VSGEYPGSKPEDTEKTEKRKPVSELWGPWYVPARDDQANRPAPPAQFKRPGEIREPAQFPSAEENAGIDPQAPYREHVSGVLPAPAGQPGVVPGTPPGIPHSAYPLPAGPDVPRVSGYPPIQSYPPYPLYPPPYPPYPYQPYPPEPKRDGYLFGVAIASLIGSILVLLGGLFAALVWVLLVVSPNLNGREPANQQFMGVVTFLAFALIGVIGGSFGIYHSVRSAFLRKPSAGFRLPTFWLFVLLYLGVIAAGYVLHVRGQDLANPSLTIFLILMAGLMPALAVLALGDRRLRFPKGGAWPTTWRRFALAIVSGATLGILVAGVLELLFSIALVHGQGIDPYLCLTNPNAAQCQNPQIYNLLLIAVAVIAPIIEEAVKPLAAIILIGRVRSAAEAFVLGLSCGIGFDLIETSGYISSGYTDWLSTALERTGSGLLHGLGAAMVTLGWYYLTHPGKRRVPKALGCWLYAVVQHAIWNGTWGTLLLPGAAGQFFSNTLTIGSVPLPYYYFINIGEAVAMLVFFLYMTGRLRRAPASASQLEVPGLSP